MRHSAVGKGLASIVVMAVLAGLAGGCERERDRDSIVEMEGIISEIDAPREVVTVRAYLAKHKLEREFEVHATEETEILINGSLATLSDLKIGEKAVGTIRIERDGDDKRYVALSVQIERAEVIVAPHAKQGPAPDEGE
jgi:hypothetical protein